MRRTIPWTMPAFLPFARGLAKLDREHFLIRQFMKGVPEVDRDSFRNPVAYEAMIGSFDDASCNGTRSLITDGDIYFADWEFNISEITRRICIWHGELDAHIPVRMAREVAARLPNSQPKWFPDEAHFSLPTNQANAILDDFVQELDSVH